MKANHADYVSWGMTVVAAILLFAAFVALFRRDLGNPYVAAGAFAAAGVAVWLIGRAIVHLARRHHG